MKALILVCALTVTAPDCQKDTSIHHFYAPETTDTTAGCVVNGMTFAAESGLVEVGTYPKIVCLPEGRTVATTR